MIKELKDIAWNVTEEEYRADSAFSYSALSTFDREGLEGMGKPVKGYPIDFGSLVDTILTEEDQVENKFVFTNATPPTDVMKDICDELLLLDQPLQEIGVTKIYEVARNNNYGSANWKKETIHAKVLESISNYFELMKTVGDKTIMSIDDKIKADRCVETMFDRFSNYFTDTSFMKHYFQLKFKTNVEFGDDINRENIEYRSMFDLINVDYVNKIIYPKDIKTTGKRERDFIDSFYHWRYIYQGFSYAYNLKKTILEDEYFKDFEIADFSFLVVNRDFPKPFEFILKGSGYKANEPAFKKLPNVVYNNKVIVPWYVTLYDLYKTYNLNNNKGYKFSENQGVVTIDINQQAR